ncbi:MAG TPA: NifB/NifX family molybdenum-iron cluster-binding protein [Syntrophales bacterium]|nr:NifB/NifX family molybdenum-iron cluster-binding protein [Syntrophales bacterium]
MVNDEKIKVAVATTVSSGLVDLHFGHTNLFSIYEVNPDTLYIQFLEKRTVREGYCKGPECDLPEGQEDLLKNIVDLLRDCKFLLTRRIGTVPAKSLKEAGITTIESADTIESAIKMAITL